MKSSQVYSSDDISHAMGWLVFMEFLVVTFEFLLLSMS